MTVPVELSPELEAHARQRAVQNGQDLTGYLSRMLEMALAADREAETSLTEEQWRELDAATERGIADADAGRVRPAEETFARLRARLAANSQGV